MSEGEFVPLHAQQLASQYVPEPARKHKVVKWGAFLIGMVVCVTLAAIVLTSTPNVPVAAQQAVLAERIRMMGFVLLIVVLLVPVASGFGYLRRRRRSAS